MHPLESLTRLTKHIKGSPDESANAAVAILLRPNPRDLEIFLVKRAEVPGDPWSGDMAFPGGKRHSQDRSLGDTAIRETMEETGIRLEELEPLGYMEPLQSWVRNTFVVQPIVYLYEGDPPIRLNYELTRYMWVPLEALRGSKEHAVVKGFDSPIYRVGEEVVWGLTYRMLEKLLEMLGEG